MTDRLLYDRKTAAGMLSISVKTLDRLLGTKQLVARRIGRKVLIPHAELAKISKRDVVKV